MRADWSSVSRREAEILGAVREHLTNAEIAARFFISERTVESHVSSLLRKLAVRDRVELAGLVPPAPDDDRRSTELPGRVEVLVHEPLLGRTDALDRLRSAWTTAAAGQTTLAVVTGEAGVGKSRLVAELAATAHRAGGSVLWGACFEDPQAPYQPIADAFEDHGDLLASATRDGEAGETARLVARTVGLLPPDDPEATDLTGGPAHLARALRQHLGRLGSTAPVLLVVEDLHWAAPSTREVLLHLARAAGSLPLLVVGTARDTQPDLAPATKVFLGQCERLPNGERITLHGLGAEEVAGLLGSLGSPANPGAVYEETGGNPLLVREVARSEAARGSSLAALLAPRYGRLDPRVIEVLDAAAVLGAAFDATLIGGVLDRPVLEVVQALDEAEGAGLVVPIPDRPGRFAFVHPLFRTLHYRDLPTSRRLELHHHAAVELERGADDDRLVVALARHACVAAPIGDPRAAIRYAGDAAAVAERVLAFDEAIHHHREALVVAELLPEDRHLRVELTINLGRVLVEAGDPKGREVLMSAATMARELADGPALADIAWAMVPFGQPPTPGAPDPAYVALAEDALDLLGEEASGSRARVLAGLSAQLTVSGDARRGFLCADESVHIARALEDPATLGAALLARRLAGAPSLRAEERLQIAMELHAIGERLRQPTFTMNAHYTEAWARRELGDLDGHDRALASYQRALEQHPSVTFQMLLVLYRATQRFLDGELDAAQGLLAEVFELAATAPFDPVQLTGPMQSAIVHARGQAGAMAPLVEAQVRTQPGFGGTFEGLLAVCYAHAGRADDARRLVRTAAADSFASVQPNMSYTTGLGLYAEAAELVGEVGAGRILLELLRPLAGELCDNSASVFESVDLAMAKAALAAGDLPLARQCAATTLSSPAGRRSPLLRGRALIRLAVADGAAGEAGVLVDEALAIAERTGAKVIERDAEHHGLLG